VVLIQNLGLHGNEHAGRRSRRSFQKQWHCMKCQAATAYSEEASLKVSDSRIDDACSQTVEAYACKCMLRIRAERFSVYLDQH
jgi:hypothetical protein